MKKTFAVYGNCQASPIAKLLLNNETFSSQFELVKFAQPVFMLTNKDWPHVLEVVSKVDLLICQSVGNAFGDMLSTENLLKHTKSSAIKVSYPSIYFNGYFTEIDYFRGMPSSVNQFCDYHDLNIAGNFIKSKSSHAAIELSIAQMSDPHFYSRQQVERGVMRSIEELRQREIMLDTKISDYIATHWHEQQLFFSVNHPSRKLLLEVCHQILALLDIKDAFIPGSYEHLGETILPIYKAVGCLMQDDSQQGIKVKGKALSIGEYVSASISVYEQHERSKIEQVVMGLVNKKGQ